MNKKIDVCYFCKAEPVLHRDSYKTKPSVRFYIKCENEKCKVKPSSLPTAKRITAINRWNETMRSAWIQQVK